VRELSRGGQVFYVYNRVEGLYEKAARLAELVPTARICVGHGQMTEHALEQTMIDFVEGRYDVLCATAIIESGLDIPRANTMIIDRADMFGLSQLYQLRGARGPLEGACLLLPHRPSGQRHDRRGAGADRGPGATHRARIGLPDRLSRSRAARLRRSPRRRSRAAPWPRSASRCSARCSTKPCTSSAEIR